MGNIRRISATQNPLSADVVIYEGLDNIWIYDVGCNTQAFDELQEIQNKNIVISHFHPDHMGNLERLEFDNLYVGKNTFRYTKQGVIVETEIEPEKGIRIIPIPSSHAKGSLAFLIENEYLLVGDAFYPQHKGDKRAYNVQHLHAQIVMLEQMDVRYIGFSHQKDFFEEKEVVLMWMKSIYEKRVANEAFIYV